MTWAKHIRIQRENPSSCGLGVTRPLDENTCVTLNDVLAVIGSHIACFSSHSSWVTAVIGSGVFFFCLLAELLSGAPLSARTPTYKMRGRCFSLP